MLTYAEDAVTEPGNQVAGIRTRARLVELRYPAQLVAIRGAGHELGAAAAAAAATVAVAVAAPACGT